VSVVEIILNGVDVTDDVLFATATFTSQANGTPGTCSFRIKDPGHDYSVTTGKRLTLKIDDVNAWTGYVARVLRVYAFPAMDTSSPSSVTRFLQVDGVDINILFDKRVVFDLEDPEDMRGITYTQDNTPDYQAVHDLVTDYLDLDGDDLDAATLVENVGTINVDSPANVIAPGHTWRSAMRSITALSSGVFYINPDRELVLTDVDTKNAPYGLTDTP
jgi:hypothetical protein